MRIGVLTSATGSGSNRRIGYVAMLAFAILLPTVDPVSLALEIAPLLILFELSIWLSVVMETLGALGTSRDVTTPTPPASRGLAP